MPRPPKKNRKSSSDPVKAFLARIGAKGGKAGKGKAKARSSEQARKAAKSRWKRRKAGNAIKNPVSRMRDALVKTELRRKRSPF